MNAVHDASISIIVPTFQEAKNIPELVQRIAQINLLDKFELILMDDNSQDGIDEIVQELQCKFSWLRLFVRKTDKGLNASVIEGFSKANYSTVVVMDADLSHPPEKIPEMLAIFATSGVDLVIGSRYVAGGSTDPKWPVSRKLTSKFAALITRYLISVPIKDPLSGFFAIKKYTLENGDPLSTIGWKIGLEIAVKCHCKNIYEVPIHFSERYLGKSKFNIKIAMDYFKHVAQLIFYKFKHAFI